MRFWHPVEIFGDLDKSFIFIILENFQLICNISVELHPVWRRGSNGNECSIHIETALEVKSEIQFGIFGDRFSAGSAKCLNFSGLEWCCHCTRWNKSHSQVFQPHSQIFCVCLPSIRNICGKVQIQVQNFSISNMDSTYRKMYRMFLTCGWTRVWCSL